MYGGVIMSKLFNDPFSLIVIIIVASGFLYAMYYQFKVRRNGIEATAYVDRIEEVTNASADTIDTYYDFYVIYVTRDGKQVEGCISNPVSGLEVGDQVRIKYIETNPEYPVFISKI